VPDIPPNVTAVLTALKFRGSRRESLRTLTDAEWENLLSRWEILRLMVPLRHICGDDLPEWVRSRIDQNLADNAQRFERIKAVYSDFRNALRDSGAEHLVVKGFAQWPGFVDHPRFRLQSDIDVYCPPDSIYRARDALSNLGYEPARGIDFGASDHLPTMVLKTSWKWRGNHYDPDMPVSFEPHFCFWNESFARFGPKGLDQFWLRRIERRLDNFSFPALSPVDNVGYCALNVLRDALRSPMSIHLVYELARFLHTNADNEEFWSSWKELHDDTLRCLEVISFRMASHCFACRLSEEVEREANLLPNATQAWFQKFADSPLSASFRLNKDALLLHLTLIETPRDKLAVLFKRLFPTPIESVESVSIHNTVIDGQKSVGAFRERIRYVGYLISRGGYHTRAVLPTLWHGVRFWLSTKNMSKGFWTFLAACFCFDFGMYIFFLLYNLYLLDRGFKENFLGLVASAAAIGGIAGTIPAGLLAQRLGLRKALLLCLTLVPVTFAMRSLLVRDVPLLFLAFFGGAAVAIWAVCISPAIAQLTNEQSRPFGFSVVFSSGIAVGVLGGQAGGRLPGWLAHLDPVVTAMRAKQMSLLIACGIVALAMLPIVSLRFESAPARKKKFYPRNPFLARFLPAIALWSLAIAAFTPFFNAYFSQYLRMPLKQIGVVYSASQLSQVLAILAAPVIFRKYGLVTGIMYTQIAAATGLACLAAVHGASTAAIIYVGYTGFQWMSEPAMFSLLMNNLAPSERTGGSALNFLVTNVSSAIAAAAAGASFARFGYPAVLSVTAGVALVAAFMFRFMLGKDPLSSAQTSSASLGVQTDASGSG